MVGFAAPLEFSSISAFTTKVATFAREFDAELVNKTKPWATKSQWFSFQRAFWVNIRFRDGRSVT